MHLVPLSSVLCEHRCSECHILIKDANEILLVISTFFVRGGETLLEEICAKLLRACDFHGNRRSESHILHRGCK